MNTRKTIQVYIPVKWESHIKGYWKDKDRVYIDNILISNYTPIQFERVKSHLFSAGELAIFYIENGIAYIQSKSTLERLTKRIIFDDIKLEDIQGLLTQYGGLTYFQDKQQAHIWQL